MSKPIDKRTATSFNFPEEIVLHTGGLPEGQYTVERIALMFSLAPEAVIAAVVALAANGYAEPVQSPNEKVQLTKSGVELQGNRRPRVGMYETYTPEEDESDPRPYLDDAFSEKEIGALYQRMEEAGGPEHFHVQRCREILDQLNLTQYITVQLQYDALRNNQVAQIEFLFHAFKLSQLTLGLSPAASSATGNPTLYITDEGLKLWIFETWLTLRRLANFLLTVSATTGQFTEQSFESTYNELRETKPLPQGYSPSGVLTLLVNAGIVTQSSGNYSISADAATKLREITARSII